MHNIYYNAAAILAVIGGGLSILGIVKSNAVVVAVACLLVAIGLFLIAVGKTN
jgi:hypothetical protein